MATDKKLYIAILILAVMAGVFVLQQKSAEQERATYTLEGRTADLPDIGATEEKTSKIDRILIDRPESEAGQGLSIELKKEGSEWQVVKPWPAKAHQVNVTSIISNLKSLKLAERIDSTAKNYEQYGLVEGKAMRARYFEGDKVLFDFYFGQDGSRGRMARLGDRDGVWSVRGHSHFLFSREAKGYRDLSLLKFDKEDVRRIEITNENGSFTFEQIAAVEQKASAGAAGAPSAPTTSWTGKFKKAKAPIALEIKRFDPVRVNDMLIAYANLTATDFTREKKPEEVGLDKPVATLTFVLKDGGQRIVRVGAKPDDTSRWVLVGDNPEIFSISSWSADWATAAEEKFQRVEQPANAPAPAPAAGPHDGLHDDDH